MVRYNSQLRNFRTTHPAQDALVLDRHTKEQFWSHSVEVARTIKPWLLLSVGLNGATNSFEENGAVQRFSGWSNATVGVGFQRLLKSYDNGHNLYALAKINYGLPMGENKSSAQNTDYNEAIYPSTGANAYTGALQLLYNRKKALYYGQANATINGRSPENFRFGSAVNLALGMAFDAHSFNNNRTIVLGAESALYHSYANQYFGKKLPDNNGTYMVVTPQVGYKTEDLSVLFRKAVVLHQNIGSGNTQLKNQVEINLTIKI